MVSSTISVKFQVKFNDWISVISACSSSVSFLEGSMYIYNTDEFIDDRFLIGLSVELNITSMFPK